MATLKAFLSLLVVGVYIIAFSACEREGPAERAGEKIDEAGKRAGEAIEETGEKARDAVR